jgi:predicted transcriptional regulator
MKRHIRIGRIFGIEIGLHFSWLVIAAAAKASCPKPSAPKILSPLCVGEVMRRDCETVSGRIDLQEFVNRYLLNTRDRCYFVAENNRPVGLISTEHVKKIPSAQWQTKTVSQVMLPLHDVQIVAPLMPVAKAYETMLNTKIDQLPVASSDQLKGIITRDDILENLYTHVTVQN